MSPIDTEDLIDYEDDVPTGTAVAVANGAASGAATADGDDKDKKNFSGIHSTGFRYVFSVSPMPITRFDSFCLDRDFLLKPELLRAISDLGFEHPSEGEALSGYSNPGKY